MHVERSKLRRSRLLAFSERWVHACARRQGRSDLLMAAFRNMTLRDHLCWIWRIGSDSADPVLAEAALLAAQVLRVLGVEHGSLDTLLCQVRAQPISKSCRLFPVLCLAVVTHLPHAAWTPELMGVPEVHVAKCHFNPGMQAALCSSQGCCLSRQAVGLAAGAAHAGGQLPQVPDGPASVHHRLGCAQLCPIIVHALAWHAFSAMHQPDGLLWTAQERVWDDVHAQTWRTAPSRPGRAQRSGACAHGSEAPWPASGPTRW
jgi:hypothetical protein